MLWATVAPRRSGGIDTRTKHAWKVMSPRKHFRCCAATNYIRKAVQRGRGTAVASRLGDVVMVNTHANTVAVIVPSRHQRRAPLLPNINTPAADLAMLGSQSNVCRVEEANGICILRITYECAERGTDAVAMT